MKLSKIKEIDIFGVEPKFFVNDKSKFKSFFGALLTFILFGIISTSCWLYGNDLYFKKNPYVSFAERYQVKPEHFKIQKDTLNFAVGLTASNKQHYLDETIYTVKMDQFIMKKIPDENGKTQIKVKKTPLKVKICEKEDFGTATSYFQNLVWLNQIYCMDPDQDAFIEGDYGQDVFATISIDFYPCQNTTTTQNCKPKETIDQAIRDNYYSTYITDSLVDPKNFTNPFTDVGRNVYGVASGDTFKQVDYLYRIVEINDNSGILFDNITKKKGIQFTTEKENIKMKRNEDGLFLRIQVRHEKIKKTVIQRTYLNIAEVLAKVGGILKVFMSIFAVMSAFVSQKLYRMMMVNTLFQFKYKNHNQKKRASLNKQQQQNNNINKDEMENTPRPLKFQSLFSVFTNICQREQIQENKDLLNHADQKIMNYLNIQKIIEKMMEIDKLKLILFNKHQKQLFDYLPKPVISKESLNIKRYRQPSAILGQDLRLPSEKKKDAIISYKKLKINMNKTPLDDKILQILEEANFIEENNIDLNFLHQYQERDETVPSMYQSVISPSYGQIPSPTLKNTLKRKSQHTSNKVLLSLKECENSALESKFNISQPQIQPKMLNFEENDWYQAINVEMDYTNKDQIRPPPRLKSRQLSKINELQYTASMSSNTALVTEPKIEELEEKSISSRTSLYQELFLNENTQRIQEKAEYQNKKSQNQ